MFLLSSDGQCCCAASRTFVQESIYDGKKFIEFFQNINTNHNWIIWLYFFFCIAFVAKSVELARKRKVGNPFAEGVLQGPQIDAAAQQKVLKYFDLGCKQGAKLELGGKKWGSEGFFVEPTVFSNVTDNMAIAQEEVNHLR